MLWTDGTSSPGSEVVADIPSAAMGTLSGSFRIQQPVAPSWEHAQWAEGLGCYCESFEHVPEPLDSGTLSVPHGVGDQARNLLRPRLEVARRREAGRGTRLWEEWAWLDEEIRTRTRRIGLWLDNSDQTPDETVDEVPRRGWTEGLAAEVVGPPY